ncbi:PAS domain S-box [Burkholderiales bacterium JOSHI_001]|nr:PAS domain S-box [Burkholderiales bacterium JOSHI_001]
MTEDRGAPGAPKAWFPLRLGGLRAQLTLFTVGAMLASLSLLAAYTLHEQTRLARTGLEQQAAAVARSIALGSESPLLDERLDTVEELTLRAADFPGVNEVWVMDAHGSTLTHVKRQPGGGALSTPYGKLHQRLPRPALAQPLIETGEQWLVAWHPVQAGRLLGWVRVDHSTTTLQDIRRRILASTVAACALALLGSLLMLRALLRRPMDALDRARHFATRLEQDAGEQLPDPGGARETSQLVLALNRLSSQLQRQHQDITEAFARLQRQESQLADRNEQLANIFALSPDGLVSMDSEGQIRFANPAFARLLGLEAPALLGRSEAWLDAQLRAASEQAEQLPPLAQVLDAGSTGRHSLVLARPRSLQLRLVGVRGHSAAASRLLLARDMTHDAEVDRLKSEFIATAAHELRTPMTSIHGFTELLMDPRFPPGKQAQVLAKVHRHSSAMIEIVNDLLDLSRLEARGGSDFEPSTVDLADLVRETIGDLALPAERAAPQWQAPAVALQVRADRRRLAQVLRNLLSNAYKYSPAGGAVQVRLGQQDGEVALAVCDQGMGMSPDQVARVCERFYRADTSGNIAGTGLGMSIVKEIVQLHGGRLLIDSAPGRGTTVSVRLPLLAAPGPQANAPLPRPAAQALAA